MKVRYRKDVPLIKVEVPQIGALYHLVWARSSGIYSNVVGNSISSDKNGNTFVTGYFKNSVISFGTDTLTNSSPGLDEFFIVKYNALGNVLWGCAIARRERLRRCRYDRRPHLLESRTARRPYQSAIGEHVR